MSRDERSSPEDDVVEAGALAALRDEFADIDKSVSKLRKDARQAAIERAGE